MVIDWCPVPDAKQPFNSWVAARAASDEELKEKIRVEVVAGESGEMMRMLAEPGWLAALDDDQR